MKFFRKMTLIKVATWCKRQNQYIVNSPKPILLLCIIISPMFHLCIDSFDIFSTQPAAYSVSINLNWNKIPPLAPSLMPMDKFFNDFTFDIAVLHDQNETNNFLKWIVLASFTIHSYDQLFIFVIISTF